MRHTWVWQKKDEAALVVVFVIDLVKILLTNLETLAITGLQRFKVSDLRYLVKNLRTKGEEFADQR